MNGLYCYSEFWVLEILRYQQILSAKDIRIRTNESRIAINAFPQSLQSTETFSPPKC